MKTRKLITMAIICLIAINITGCSKQVQEQVEEEPYVKYIITTYSGGKEIDKFEVYSNMQGYYNKYSVTVYDSPSEGILLFYSTLDYKLEEVIK